MKEDEDRGEREAPMSTGGDEGIESSFARYRTPVYLAAYSGLRAGELWALRVAE